MSLKLTKSFASEIAAATATELGGWQTVVESEDQAATATVYFVKDDYIIRLYQNEGGELAVRGEYQEIGKLEVMGLQRPTMTIPHNSQTTASEVVAVVRDIFLPKYVQQIDKIALEQNRFQAISQAKETLARALVKASGRILLLTHSHQPEVSADTGRWYVSARVLAPDKVHLVISTDGDLAVKIIKLLASNKK